MSVARGEGRRAAAAVSSVTLGPGLGAIPTFVSMDLSMDGIISS